MSEEMRISLTREEYSLLYRVYLEARDPERLKKKQHLRAAVAAYEAHETREREEREGRVPVTPAASENR
jgi:hypothetical protein